MGRLTQSWKAKVGLSAVSLAVSLIAVEASLRLAGISHPLFFETDRVTGSRHRHGSEGLYTREGRAYVRINSDGFRDREYDREKAADTFRIAVLGDSYTSAFEVDATKTFVSVAEAKLRTLGASPKPRVEVMNFGVQGYSTAQELLVLRQHVFEYQPDLVLLAFFSGNDVTGNSPEVLPLDRIPYFVHRSGKLELDDSFLTSDAFRKRQSWLARSVLLVAPHSRIVQVLNNLRFARARRGPTKDLPWAGIDGSAEEGLLNALYVPPTDSDWTEAWLITEDLIRLFHSDCAANGADFRLVVLSNSIQVHPDAALQKRMRTSLGVEDLYYPERRLTALGASEGFPVLTLAPELSSYAVEHQVFLHGFEPTLGTGHWNELGHRLSGSRIADWIAAAPPFNAARHDPSSTTKIPAASRAN